MSTLEIKMELESENYLHFIYKGKKQKINEFSNKFNNQKDEFYLDKLIKKCKLEYKGKKYTYDEIKKIESNRLKALNISNLYTRVVENIESNLLAIDKDYYIAGKMLKSSEEILMCARYALSEAMEIIDYNIKAHWDCGYSGIYKLRTIKANQAILAYNNFCDSVMQIVFFAFGIYKKHKKYTEDMKYTDMLSMCNYTFLNNFLENNESKINNLELLLPLVKKIHQNNKKINEWANYIKHKGGILYKGLDDEFYTLNILNKERDLIRSTDDFKLELLDLDYVICEMEKAHVNQCNVLEELIGFINFKGTTYIDLSGRTIVQEENIYKKIIIN